MFSSKRARTFDHKFFEYEDLVTENIDGKRFYLTPIGPLRSVTTILGEKLDKSYLEIWRNKIGQEAADRILHQAGARGTAVHDICEKYLMNEVNYKRETMPSTLDTFSKMRPFLDENIGEIYGIEIPLWSEKLQTAGRSDLVCQWKGKNSVVDFKTSLKTKKEDWIEGYFIQSSCYGSMVGERFNMKIEQIVIIIAVDNDKTLVFEKDPRDYHTRMYEIFS